MVHFGDHRFIRAEPVAWARALRCIIRLFFILRSAFGMWRAFYGHINFPLSHWQDKRPIIHSPVNAAFVIGEIFIHKRMKKFVASLPIIIYSPGRSVRVIPWLKSLIRTSRNIVILLRLGFTLDNKELFRFYQQDIHLSLFCIRYRAFLFLYTDGKTKCLRFSPAEN